MAGRARPTLRCLREDLQEPVPPADTPLEEVPHPLLAKASEQFADDAGRHERIASIGDQVLLKVKVQRWRGAVWVGDDGIPWLVAAGQREHVRRTMKPTASRDRGRQRHRKTSRSAAYVPFWNHTGHVQGFGTHRDPNLIL
jgi:hypothetical protein